MKTVEFRPRGVCSRLIRVSSDDNDIITSVDFSGGCSGNLSGISKLVKGMKADDVIALLKGTKCGFKETSCPDQLARALEELKKQK